MSNETLVADAKPLEDMTLQEVRKIAASVYRIAVMKESTKEDLIGMIREKEKGTTFAKVVASNSNVPAPGWARIILHKDTAPGALNRPVYWSINGRRYCVPRGVKVDVPCKLVDGPMKDALERRRVEDVGEPLNSPARFKWELIPCYPYSELIRTEGPDPQPGDELARGRKRKPEYDFRDKFGFWPTPDQLKEALKGQLVRTAI